MSGIRLINRALEEPLRMIAQNAGHEGYIIVEKVRANDNVSFGFNAETEKYEDLMQAGVLDPVKVSRTALQNAASVAGLLLTTEAVVSELPEKKKAASGGPEMDY
ncbi:MAG: chaperonin GroEL [bacterium]|nr:MAG: chaperonin GroEL [bacterium]